MEMQNEHEIARREALEADLQRRAASLRMKRDDYLQALHDDDRTLEFDRAILATVVVWAPVWVLLAALLSPQGQELLAEFESGTYSRVVLFIMLALLCLVASVFASTLIAGWFFPRIVDAVRGGGWLWPGIPEGLRPLDRKERREAFAWTVLPAIISIAVPLAIVLTATFGLSGWLARSVWLCVLVVYSCVTLLAISVATRFALEVISGSKVLIFVGVAGWLTLGLAPVWATSAIGTPTIVVAVAIFWLLAIQGFTYLAFLSRYDATRARLLSPSSRRHRLRMVLHFGLPRVLKRHAVLALLIGAVALFFWLVPGTEVWMSADDGRLAAEESRPPGTSSEPSPSLSLASAFDKFTAELPKTDRRPSLVLVTAAGGGIRAAYWTGAVLSALQDKEQSFDKRVFAISAVSGGALGAATYKALTLRDQAPCSASSTYRGCAADFLGGDFVGPSVLSAVSGEVSQVFFRGRGIAATRDQALQLGWSYRWLQVSGGMAPSFSGDFDALFANRPTPALLLNGTSMVSGRRTVTSTLDVGSLVPNRNLEGKDCPSEAGILNPAQHLKLSVSAAVLTSARFPYVSPPGLLQLVIPKPKDEKEEGDKAKRGTNCRTWDEIVDGGYVDNEGVITMRDVLNRLIEQTPSEGKDASEAFAKAYRVIVIRLSTQPSPPDPALSEKPPSRDQLNQLYTAFTNQRTASGRDLLREFRTQIVRLRGCWIEFNALYDDAPLGWSLGVKSRNRLDAWLDGPSSARWQKLHQESSDAADKRVIDLAREVDLQGRLDLVRDLVNGRDVPCDRLKDNFN